MSSETKHNQAELATVDVKREGLNVSDWNELVRVAGIVAGANMANNAQEAAVRMAYGAEFGLMPMTALANVNVIKGRPTLSSTCIASQIQRAAGYELVVDELTHDVCRVTVTVNGRKRGTSEFTIEDAKRACLIDRNQVWRQYPKNMLFARAISNLAKFFTPELFHGSVYSPDEMRDDSGVDETNQEALPAETNPEEPGDPDNAVDAEFEEKPKEGADETPPPPIGGPAPDKELATVEARLKFFGIPVDEWAQVLGSVLPDGEPTPLVALASDEVAIVLAAFADSSKWKRGAK